MNAPKESAWQGCAKDTEIFLRHIDFDSGIDPEKIIEPARMIAMTMRDHNEIELFEIDVLCLDVMGKDVSVVAGVEEDLFAAIFDVGGKPPVFLHL